MRIIFVRHGETDYDNDSLTPEGHRQATAVAERLSWEGIREIYASPSECALQTAAYTAQLLGLNVVPLSFMREIFWGGSAIPYEGRPWKLGCRMLKEGFEFIGDNWRLHPWFAENSATRDYDTITAKFDEFLCEKGYRHEGRRFLCQGGEDKTIAVFSHGGPLACLLAHLLVLPFPYMISVLPHDLTGVTLISFPVAQGEWIFPRVDLFNDSAHICQTGGRNHAAFTRSR